MSYNNSSSTLCHALDLYINLIEYSFNNDSKLIEKYYLNFSNENLNLSQNSKLNLEKLFVNIWHNDEIKLISSLLDLSSKKNNESKEYYITSIKSILDTKKIEIKKIIQNTTELF